MCFYRFLQNTTIVIICCWLFCAFCCLISHKRFYILLLDKSATIYYCANKCRIIVKYESVLYLLTLTFPCINCATIFFVRHNPSAGNETRRETGLFPLTFKVNALKQLLITPAVKTRFSFFRVQNLILIVGLEFYPLPLSGPRAKIPRPARPAALIAVKPVLAGNKRR